MRGLFGCQRQALAHRMRTEQMNTDIKTGFKRIEQAFDSCLTSMDKDYDCFCNDIVNLCQTLNSEETDEFIWHSIGEFGEFCLSDLIIGAYWHFTEWHGGQASKSYLALSSLGTIVTPNYSQLEEDAPEALVFEILESSAKSFYQ
jgi:hypothetical protein